MKFIVDVQCNPTVDKKLLAEMLEGLVSVAVEEVYKDNYFHCPVKVKLMPIKRKKKNV